MQVEFYLRLKHGLGQMKKAEHSMHASLPVHEYIICITP